LVFEKAQGNTFLVSWVHHLDCTGTTLTPLLSCLPAPPHATSIPSRHPGVAIRRRRTRDNDGRLTNASFIRLQRPVKEVLAALEAHTGYTTSGLAPGFKDYERDAEGLDEVMYHPRDRMCGARAGSLKAAVVGTTYLTPATCRVDDVEMEEVLEEDEEMIDVAATTAAAEGAYIHTGVTRSQRHVKKMYSSQGAKVQ
jgi:hypothetical protein